MDTQLREKVRLAVHSAMGTAFPELVSAPFEDWKKPGGIQLIHDHIETLIEIVQAAPDGGADAWRKEILKRICPGCRERFASGFCWLRETDGCALETSLDIVAAAIKDVMNQ